jgi:2-phosphosulfolactate phosphatase
MKKSIDVCLSPQLLGLFDISRKIVVVVDIFRATTTMISALAFGASVIRAVSTVEEALSLKNHGFLIAGERGGEKVEGFDLGNSPFDFMNSGIKGKSIAITTTNGTLSINKSSHARKQIIGSFINFSATANYLINLQSDILILCAGWKGSVNLEDTFYAGALIEALERDFVAPSDSCKLAASLFWQNNMNPLGFLEKADHALRLIRIGFDRDIAFCLQRDLHDIIGVVRNGDVMAMSSI